MKIAALIARLLLGLMFVVFGLNGFFHFIPMGPMPTGLAGQFMGALLGSHYGVVVYVLQIVAGALFLSGFYLPLALVLIGPVLVNILCYHICLEPAGFQPGVLATILWLIVYFRVRPAFKGIFQAKVTA